MLLSLLIVQNAIIVWMSEIKSQCIMSAIVIGEQTLAKEIQDGAYTYVSLQTRGLHIHDTLIPLLRDVSRRDNEFHTVATT